MKGKTWIWILAGAGVTAAAWFIVRSMRMTEDEAIAIIAKYTNKDYEKLRKTIKDYQELIEKNQAKYDFAVEPSFLVARAQAFKRKEPTFSWKKVTYDTETGRKFQV